MKKILCVLAALAMLVAMVACNKDGGKGTNDKRDELKNAKVGDYIFFGKYEQDNNIFNGSEDIEWLVLANENNKLLVISKYGLDCQHYNELNSQGPLPWTDVTWETCSLRKWLNETFINKAFSTEEQKLIQTTTVTADKNPKSDTAPGNDTTDKVFLLSITEVNKYFSSNEARECVLTAYAVAQSAYAESMYDKVACSWWLRSPGNSSGNAAYVIYTGDVLYIGYFVNDGGDASFGVRPAMWISL